MTQQSTRTFTVADPRNFEDGTPYEVAARAGAQAVAVARILQDVIEGGDLMARNAYMSRNLDLGNEAAGDGWRMSAEGRAWAALDADLAAIRRRLETLTKAASFDPKHPPKTV
jgi:hypothetical protein